MDRRNFKHSQFKEFEFKTILKILSCNVKL